MRERSREPEALWWLFGALGILALLALACSGGSKSQPPPQLDPGPADAGVAAGDASVKKAASDMGHEDASGLGNADAGALAEGTRACPHDPRKFQRVKPEVKKRLEKICLSEQPCNELRTLLCERYVGYAKEGLELTEWVKRGVESKRKLATWMDEYLSAFLVPVLKRHKEILIWGAKKKVDVSLGLKGAEVVLTEQAIEDGAKAMKIIREKIDKLDPKSSGVAIYREQFEILKLLHLETFHPKPKSVEAFREDANEKIESYQKLIYKLDGGAEPASANEAK